MQKVVGSNPISRSFAVDDQQLLDSINELVEEENRLLRAHEGEGLSATSTRGSSRSTSASIAAGTCCASGAPASNTISTRTRQATATPRRSRATSSSAPPLLRRAFQRAAATRRALVAAVRRPPWARPGHFNSPLTNPADVDRALSWAPDLPGVDLREGEQVELARRLAPRLVADSWRRYRPGNPIFGLSDAALYRAALHHFRPQRVIEVGAGYSTAVLFDTVEQGGWEVDVTCIEPLPERLLSLLRPADEVDLIRAPAQDVAPATYASLEAGDLLFIDSTHVGKAGSDVLWLYLRVLPRLSPGVLVHIHDVFWPFEYPREWLDEGRDWNEDYFLHAFLCHNAAWEIVLFASWLWHHHLDLVPAPVWEPGATSLWMRRRR
jgi:Methyltransferase domain